MLTIEETTEVTVPAIADAEATPLSNSEINSLLALSASSEKKAKGQPVAFHIQGQAD